MPGGWAWKAFALGLAEAVGIDPEPLADAAPVVALDPAVEIHGGTAGQGSEERQETRLPRGAMAGEDEALLRPRRLDVGGDATCPSALR